MFAWSEQWTSRFCVRYDSQASVWALGLFLLLSSSTYREHSCRWTFCVEVKEDCYIFMMKDTVAPVEKKGPLSAKGVAQNYPTAWLWESVYSGGWSEKKKKTAKLLFERVFRCMLMSIEFTLNDPQVATEQTSVQTGIKCGTSMRIMEMRRVLHQRQDPKPPWKKKTVTSLI